MLLFWVGLLSGVILKIANACPVSCSCKWKNGKQTVICDGRGLVDIPDGLDPGTQVLNFSGNFMSTLPDDLFANKQLINLQKIYLSNCQIKIINGATFAGLTNLVELDLSENALETVPTASFRACPSLMRLTLNSNPLTVLKRLAFNHLSILTTLEITNCKLVTIEPDAFQGLSSLDWLFLDDNRLKTIQAALPQNLKGVELRGNPWQCDCHIKALHVWLATSNTPISSEPTCLGPPRLERRAIKSIPAPELACLPDVSPTTFYLELAEGKNVSLQCHVHSDPEASVSWWFRGKLLQNNTLVSPNVHLIYFVEEGVENKRSELFIYNANSEDNGTYVCSAENAAGTSQSNFTIRIIIKEDPIVIIVTFPFEYVLAVVAGVVALGLIIVAVIVISILRCKNKKPKKSKEPVLQRCEAPEPIQPKTNSDEEVAQCGEVPVVLAYQTSPTNPDLINGCRQWVDAEGYPVDYGLPKPGYYRTLPCTRRQPAKMRYSQEAEFLASFYHTDVRYTVEGYPLPNPCCSMQWSACVPANVHVIGTIPACYDDSSIQPPVNKRCVSAQTEDGEETKIDAVNDALTESPDEGYEGEAAVV